MKKIGAFIPLLILVIIIALASLAIYNSSTKKNIIKEENSQGFNFKKLRYPIKLPEFSVMDVFDDEKSLSIKDIKNKENRYSIINFFASWCTTCLAEHDALMKLKNNDSVNFYGIAWHDYSANAVEFLTKNGNPFDKVGLDAKGMFTRLIQLKAVPETIVVNPDGYVILRINGNINEVMLYEILNFIEEQK